MRRPLTRLPAPAALAAALLLVTAPVARAQAPLATLESTTVPTTTGHRKVTYTGYVNGESFQQDALRSFGGRQYAVWWDDALHVTVGRRQLPAGAWETLVLTDYTGSSADSHNVVSLGISAADGTLHLAFDMHDSTLQYRRSVPGLVTDPAGHPWTPEVFGPVRTSLTGGQPLTGQTYPQFLDAPGGRLQLVLRSGASGSGNEDLHEYADGAWTTVGTFVNGVASSRNAYLFGIEYDREGVLHATWTWRETPDASTNHDLLYARSSDRGRSWQNTAGTPIATTGRSPITPDSPGIAVWRIGQNRGLINQESQVVDAHGVVHVLASHLPAAAADQSDFTTARRSAVLVHYYRDLAGSWHQQPTSVGEGSSRGDIVADPAGNLVVLCGHSEAKQLRLLTASAAAGWADWTVRYTSAPVYFSDPILDHAGAAAGAGAGAGTTVSGFAPRDASGRIDVLDWRLDAG